MALAVIDRGRGARGKRLEGVLSEGKKNDREVTVLGVLGLICLSGLNWSILKYFGPEVVSA